MEANKIVLNGNTILDLSGDNVTENDVALGVKFHKSNGESSVGTGTFGSAVEPWDKDYLITGEPTESEDGLAINGIIREYKVNAGASVSAGDFVEFVNKFGSGDFYTGKLSDLSACKLDNNRVLVAYSDINRSNYGTARVLTFDGSVITAGESTIFNSADTTYISVCTLTDNKIIVAYTDGENFHYGEAVILTISDTNITIGTEVVFSGATTDYISICKLTENKALVVYAERISNVEDGAYARILSIEDTDITLGARITLYDTYMIKYTAVCALTDSTALVAYTYVTSGGSDYIDTKVLKIDGTTISAGMSKSIKSGVDTINSVAICELTESKAIVAFCYDDRAFAYLLAIEGASVSIADTNYIKYTTTSNIAVCKLTESKALVAYDGTARTLTVDDENITAGEPTIFNEGATEGTSIGKYENIIPFSANNALVIFSNDTGKYASLSIDGDTITVNEASGTFVQKATSNLYNVGVAKTSGAEGETVEVYCAV